MAASRVSLSIIRRLVLLSSFFLIILFVIPGSQATEKTSTEDLIPRWVSPKPEQTEWIEGWNQDLIILKFTEGSMVRIRSGDLVSLNGISIIGVLQCLEEFGNPQFDRLFSRPELLLEAERKKGQRLSGRQLADLNLYYTLIPDKSVDREELINRLNTYSVVELAYFEPLPQSGVLGPSGSIPSAAGGSHSTSQAPDPHSRFQITPNFEPLQTYLDPAPHGLDIRYAWSFPGGTGQEICFADVERGWNCLHEDLKLPDVWFGEQENFDHGTAVLGEVLGAHNGKGISGAAPDVTFGLSSFGTNFPFPVIADSINCLMNFLDEGDVFLVEYHAQGPASGEECEYSCCSFEYIPMEYWPANFDAIAAATANKIICVAIAGNGSMNLDHPRYQFLFNRSVRDSGAIICGATDSASGVPMPWTNYGSRLDLQGFGQGVVTTGYGVLYSNGPNATYTHWFGGTSAATAMVAGCCCSLQGFTKMTLGFTLTPLEMRAHLAETGTRQVTDPRTVGSRPNMRKAIDSLQP